MFHHYPHLSKYYLNFEKNYDPIPVLSAMDANNYVIPVASVVLYLLFCYFGTMVMKNLKPFSLLNSLMAWNALLSVSIIYLFSFVLN